MDNRKYYIQFLAVVAAIVLMMTACTDGMVVQDISEQEEASTPTISFKVSREISRSAFDGVSTFFEEGDLIGCVIAKKSVNGGNAEYSYVAKSKWEYRNDGFLILKELKSGDNEMANDVTSSTIICQCFPNGDQSKLKIQEDYDYAFFFYYPYVDDKMLKAEFISCKNRESLINPFCTAFIPGNPNWDNYNMLENLQKTMLVGEVAENAAYSSRIDKLTRYSWRKYPVCVNVHQDTKEKFMASDFMWTQYIIDQKTLTENINKTNANYRVDLVFRKKVAAVEVQFDEPVEDVAFYKAYSWSETNLQNIIQCNNIDLVTGELKSYKVYDNGKSLPTTSGSGGEQSVEQAKNNWSYYLGVNNLKGELLQRYSAYMNEYYYPFGYTDDKCRYRMSLIPQKIEGSNDMLYIKYKSSSDGENRVPIKELKELQENKLYIIHIDKKSNITIEINDWKMGTTTDIEEVFD